MNGYLSYQQPGRVSWLPVHNDCASSAQCIAPASTTALIVRETAGVRDKLRAWQDGVSQLFTELETNIHDPENFAGMIELVDRGSVTIAHIAAAAQSVRREGTQALKRPGDRLFLNVQLEGSSVVFGPRGQTRLAVGECILIDPHDTFMLEFAAPLRQLCVQVPDWWLREKLACTLETVVGCKVNLRVGSGAVLLSALGALLNPLPNELACGGDLLELFGNVLADTLRIAALGAGDVAPSPAEREISNRLRQFVTKNYRDDALNAASAAQALGCSLRYIHKVSAGAGTSFGAIVQDIRLSAAAHALVSSDRKTKVSTIGYACGFADISNFNRLFRRRYGTTPSQYRASRA